MFIGVERKAGKLTQGVKEYLSSLVSGVKLSLGTFSQDYKITIEPKLGRKSDELCDAAFMKIVSFLEANFSLQLTIKNLVDKMTEYLSGSESESYCPKYMKMKLKEHFQERILFAGSEGKADVSIFNSSRFL